MRRSLRTSVNAGTRPSKYNADLTEDESSSSGSVVVSRPPQLRNHQKAASGLTLQQQSKMSQPVERSSKLPPPAKASSSKPPVETLALDGTSEEIEEYIFSSDEAEEDDELDIDEQMSHISVSSDDAPDIYAIDQRPWLRMSYEERRAYETMFVNITAPALGQSWSYTEEYQVQLDGLLIQYVQDFPLSTWAIGHAAADLAYGQFRERSRWRHLGIRIYGAERLPELLQSRTSFSTHAMPPPPQHSQASVTQMRPPSVSSQTPVNGSGPQHLPVESGRTYSDPHLNYANVQSHGHPPTLMQAGAPLDRQMPYSKHKKIKETPDPPPPRPETPPYAVRHKPAELPKATIKLGKRNTRRAAEAEIFPWNRDMDFKAAQAAATWRDDLYDRDTLEIMAKVRLHNEPIIERLDREVTDKQKQSRINKKKLLQAAGENDELPPRGGRKKKDPNDKSDQNDPYHSGYFAFASSEQEVSANKLGYDTPDAVIEAGENEELSLEDLAKIKICWHPGRKGLNYDLIQAPFSAADTVITRRQLKDTPILTARACECIVDFSPDLLWRDILLRMCSEASWGNKDVRDRFCLNGCHADKATFTKRISAALGQKQMANKTGGYAPGEFEYYTDNGTDYKKYIEFFGMRATTRNMKVGHKRRFDQIHSSSVDDDGHAMKRQKSGSASEPIPVSSDGADEMSIDRSTMEFQDDHNDVVSEQDSDALADMSD